MLMIQVVLPVGIGRNIPNIVCVTGQFVCHLSFYPLFFSASYNNLTLSTLTVSAFRRFLPLLYFLRTYSINPPSPPYQGGNLCVAFPITAHVPALYFADFCVDNWLKVAKSAENPCKYWIAAKTQISALIVDWKSQNQPRTLVNTGLQRKRRFLRWQSQKSANKQSRLVT